MGIEVAPAVQTDLAELAAVAAATFPLACPPSATPKDIAAFVDEHLCQARLGEYLADPDRMVLVARAPDGTMSGYLMLIRGAPTDDDVQRAVTLRPAVEVSKLYVLAEAHGAGVAAALMTAALQKAGEGGAACVWLGVNEHNHRAQRFYTKHGFAVGGTKGFRLGSRIENDYVMVRSLF